MKRTLRLLALVVVISLLAGLPAALAKYKDNFGFGLDTNGKPGFGLNNAAAVSDPNVKGALGFDMVYAANHLYNCTNRTRTDDRTLVVARTGYYAFVIRGGDGGHSRSQGRGGNDGFCSRGGLGGLVMGYIYLTAGTTVYVKVGAAGASWVAGGQTASVYGGGKQDWYSGGGGGYTMLSTTASPTAASTADIIAVAGGGGGGGAHDHNNYTSGLHDANGGGGRAGGSGDTNNPVLNGYVTTTAGTTTVTNGLVSGGYQGGSTATAKSTAVPTANSNGGGGGGGSTSGGTNSNGNATAGGFLSGGNGASGSGYGSGGGGGGYYGGGGGGRLASSTGYKGGGGGGSSYIKSTVSPLNAAMLSSDYFRFFAGTSSTVADATYHGANSSTGSPVGNTNSGTIYLKGSNTSFGYPNGDQWNHGYNGFAYIKYLGPRNPATVTDIGYGFWPF
ncbi:MAG: hypothetical protein LBG83_08600 [Oscillospiraceae bacterium]|jgi:hypothetical protein|nr:hypothetical protein [Oscillospiraceae bacterium]